MAVQNPWRQDDLWIWEWCEDWRWHFKAGTWCQQRHETEKYCAYNPEGTKCNYPQHEGQDSGYSRCGRQWQDVRCATSDRLSSVSWQRASEFIKYPDPLARRRVCRLHFPYSSWTWRGKYTGNEFWSVCISWTQEKYCNAGKCDIWKCWQSGKCDIWKCCESGKCDI